MMEYYAKILADHPLVTYVEDCFHQFDFANHKLWREKLSNEYSYVNMGLKQVFTDGGFNRYKMVTEYQEWDEAEIERQKQIASKESQRREAQIAS